MANGTRSSTLKSGSVSLWDSVGVILLALVLYIVLWAGIVHGVLVWVLSAAVGFFIFAESTALANAFANEVTSISLVISTIALIWALGRYGDDRGFEAVFFGWFGGALFTLFFLVLSWIAPDQIPSPTELGITVGICASAVAFLAAIGHGR